MPLGHREQVKSSFESIVHQQMDFFPESRIEDLYKLIFQAAMGSEHALTDPDHALEYLQAEARGLKKSMETPLMMPISPDLKLVRLHIRPFLAGGGHLKDLARAFVQTSQAFSPSKDRLAAYWSLAEAMAFRGDLPFSYDEMLRYGEQRRVQGYPAVHHSPLFRRRYRPAYRVIIIDLIQLPLEPGDL